MGAYMAWRHHLPEDSTEDNVETVATTSLTPVERAEIDGQ